jgi:peptidylprolyl isomerase
MTTAKRGDTVKVHYTGTLEDGTVFDTSHEREPIEFTIGEGQVIPGFEAAVVGMEAGSSRSTTISPEDAYGERRNDRILTVNRDQVPEGLDPEVGQRLELKQPDGRTIPVTVARVSDTELALDANHPLAGRELTFEMKLIEIA